jgi:hypothetical protein
MANPRTRGLLLPDPRRLGEEPLADGEVSEMVRVRAPEATVRAFKALTATERGAIITDALCGPREIET